jgi:putative effector of murein hydrolase LrgA (UPF0299 family)
MSSIIAVGCLGAFLIMSSVGFRRLLNVLFHPLPAAIFALCLALLLFDAFPIDSLSYHIPFASRFLQLPGFPDFTNYFEDRYQGFPVLWRLFLGPGLIFNHQRLFVLPNLAALSLLIYCSRRILFISAPLIFCCCVAFPVAIFGFRSSLQDFFVNVMVLVALISLLQTLPAIKVTGENPRWLNWWDLVGLTCLALATNVKFQGLFMAILVISAATFFRLQDASKTCKRLRRPARLKLILMSILLILILAQPIHNLLKFGNPMYPIKFLGLPAPEARMFSPIQYIPKVPFVANAASYLSSVLEIDPIIRSKAGFSFKRSWHNHNSPKDGYKPNAADYPYVVTGGSNGLLFFSLFTGAFLSVYQLRSNASVTPVLILRRRMLLTSLGFMWLPQSMELRYYMSALFVPALVAVSGDKTQLRQFMRWIVVAGVWFVLMTSFMLPVYFWARTGQWIRSDGLLSPDIYRNLPSSQSCLQKYKTWDGLISNNSGGKPSEVQASMGCYFRLANP